MSTKVMAVALLAACAPSGRAGASEDERSSLAKMESFGYFNEPEAFWRARKHVHAAQVRRERADILKSEPGLNRGNQWWQHFAEPSFSCALEERLGDVGDGGKWVCDPYKLRQRAVGECLIYSIGSNGESGFEDAMHNDVSDKCEIHTFDLNPWEFYDSTRQRERTLANALAQGTAGSLPRKNALPPYVNFHEAALGEPGTSIHRKPTTSSTFKNWMAEHYLGWLVGTSRRPDIKAVSLPSLVQKLGHTKRTIDILKIDCEGCEFYTYKQWFGEGVDIRQVLIEMHFFEKDGPGRKKQVRDLHDFMLGMGYVIFHKEPNIQYADGDCIEFGYIKLHTTFTHVA